MTAWDRAKRLARNWLIFGTALVCVFDFLKLADWAEEKAANAQRQKRLSWCQEVERTEQKRPPRHPPPPRRMAPRQGDRPPFDL